MYVIYTSWWRPPHYHIAIIGGGHQTVQMECYHDRKMKFVEIVWKCTTRLNFHTKRWRFEQNVPQKSSIFYHEVCTEYRESFINKIWISMNFDILKRGNNYCFELEPKLKGVFYNHNRNQFIVSYHVHSNHRRNWIRDNYFCT